MPDSTKEKAPSKSEELRPYFLVAYLLEIITGILVFVVKGEEDQRLKFHSFQAIFIGILSIAVAIIFGLIGLGIIATVINLLIWLYGLYVGFEAYNGRDVEIPVISDYARRYSGYGMKTTTTKVATKK